MIVAGHQADLLPYSGFWYKMAKADLFDLKIFDTFQPRGHQSRTLMRGHWATLPVVVSPGHSRISDVRILPIETRLVLTDVITDLYHDARRWPEIGPGILDLINGIHTEHLWQFNLHLILGIREMLGINTPVSIARQPVPGDTEDVVSTLKKYNATTYLSGTRGRAYMSDKEAFQRGGINLAWSTHEPITGDSILSILMDYDDPMSIVMAESTRGCAVLDRQDVGA